MTEARRCGTQQHATTSERGPLWTVLVEVNGVRLECVNGVRGGVDGRLRGARRWSEARRGCGMLPCVLWAAAARCLVVMGSCA